VLHFDLLPTATLTVQCLNLELRLVLVLELHSVFIITELFK